MVPLSQLGKIDRHDVHRQQIAVARCVIKTAFGVHMSQKHQNTQCRKRLPSSSSTRGVNFQNLLPGLGEMAPRESDKLTGVRYAEPEAETA